MKIDTLRKKIDHLDKKLLRTLFRRFQITKKIGQIKAKTQLPVEDQSREAILLESVAKRAKSLNMRPEFAQRVFREILTESKNQQNSLNK